MEYSSAPNFRRPADSSRIFSGICIVRVENADYFLTVMLRDKSVRLIQIDPHSLAAVHFETAVSCAYPPSGHRPMNRCPTTGLSGSGQYLQVEKRLCL